MKNKLSISFILIIAILVSFSLSSCTNYEILDEREKQEYNISLFEQELINTISSPASIEKAEKSLQGEIYDYNFTFPIDWSLKDIDDRTDAYKMHSFLFLDYPYYAYSESKDEKYVEFIVDNVVHWVQTHPTVEISEDSFAWHDDATGRRTYRMSLYLYMFKEYMTEDEIELIENSLSMQADLLATEDFYTENHNHGMFQDMGLIAYSYLIDENIGRANKNLNLAGERSLEYFKNVYTEEFVHKEHSPTYHIRISENLAYFRDVFLNIDIDYSNEISNMFENSILYACSIVEPDQTVPRIGDTKDYTFASIEMQENPIYQYVTTGEGQEIEEDHVYEKSGYAVFRSSWEDTPEESTYLYFQAATYSHTHKHSDDLSFLLYHKGDLFVEAGCKDFNYFEEETAYTYSGYGHNVMMINDKDFPMEVNEKTGFRSIKESALETKITDYSIDTDVKSVTGIQKRFDDITQTRKIDYDKQNEIVTITDIVASNSEEKATFIYHIDRDIDIEKTHSGWNLLRDGAVIAKVTAESESKLTLSETIHEAGEKPYYTYVYDNSIDEQEASLLKIDVPLNVGETKVTLKIELL